ncbi:hypothetical protein CDAR_313381 [Caerostris darwini]|uniref:Uncharacterized protein n=1 Tax=Caerostris darwini TaxID=1538125 RepID=A0AAV4U9N8_9ARAC|nr:hypothetical protein CDAR_313381 [Caerostris darwini]
MPELRLIPHHPQISPTPPFYALMRIPLCVPLLPILSSFLPQTMAPLSTPNGEGGEKGRQNPFHPRGRCPLETRSLERTPSFEKQAGFYEPAKSGFLQPFSKGH